MRDPLLFALTVLTILSTPGPTNTLLATAGARDGMRAALWLIPAEGAGYLVAILALGLVVGPVAAASPPVAAALRTLVGAYLLLLAVRLWRLGGVPEAPGGRTITPRQVFVTTLLNPKAIVFAGGVVPFGAPRLWPYLVGFLGLTAVVATAWIGLGVALGKGAGLSGRRALVPRLAASLVAGFAVLLIATSPGLH